MSDLIDELPIDNSPITYEEEARISPLVSAEEDKGNFYTSNKKYLIAIGLFLLLSLPFVDALFHRIAPNKYLAASLKTFIFAILLYIVSKMI
jgi:hypothetical protein